MRFNNLKFGRSVFCLVVALISTVVTGNRLHLSFEKIETEESEASDEQVKHMQQGHVPLLPNPGRTTDRFPFFPKDRAHDISHESLYMASVVYQAGRFKISPGLWEASALAYGMLARTVNKTGWDVLDVIANADKSVSNDTATMYAAGLLEGYMTADRIVLMYQNTMAAHFATKHSRRVLLPRVRAFLTRQFEWACNFSAGNQQSTFARHTGYLMAQLQGLIDGFFAANATIGLKNNDPFVLLLLNAAGDIDDIKLALNDTIRDDFFERMSHAEFKNYMENRGHCSALVRVTPGLERLYMGHSTWSNYWTMLRMYKHYRLKLVDPDTACHSLSFSSYPGSLESTDDFYILGSKLVILETTNEVFNLSLFKTVKPQSLLSWQRVRVAGHIASNGSYWAWAVGQANSGTYNNQYMVIDLKRIRPGVSIDDDALTVVEQIPTLVVTSDQTAILRTGYFPSYNIPFHEQIYNLSGYPAIVKQRGVDFSYQMAPRAKIFRREAPRVFNHDGMASLLRFNRYTKDPYSEGDSCNSICCRKDLRKVNATAVGCMDSKFTDIDSAMYMTSYAISGPTIGSQDLPLVPFSWKQFPSVGHTGLPLAYNFSWMIMSPTAV